MILVSDFWATLFWFYLSLFGIFLMKGFESQCILYGVQHPSISGDLIEGSPPALQIGMILSGTTWVPCSSNI